MVKRNYRADYEVLAKFKSGEWAVQPTLGQIYLPAERRMLTSRQDKNGYWFIHIASAGRTIYPIARAIWIGSTMNVPEFEDLEVDHINENKSDNRFENLRLLTPAGNTSRSNAAVTFDQAEEIRRRYNAGGITKTALAKEHSCSEKTIRNIIRKRTYTCRKADPKIRQSYENISRKTKEDIFCHYCVEGWKLESTIERFNITREALRCVIEEQSLRTADPKNRRTNPHTDNKNGAQQTGETANRTEGTHKTGTCKQQPSTQIKT